MNVVLNPFSPGAGTPPQAFVVGNPARQIGWMSRHGEKLDLPLNGNAHAVCPATGERYALREGLRFPATREILPNRCKKLVTWKLKQPKKAFNG